jgi:hypothetical protein
MTYSDAKEALAEKGFKIRNLDAADNVECDSGQSVSGAVGYYGPQKAKPGSVITVCLASGVPQYSPPPPPPPPAHNTGNGGNHGGGNHGGGNGGTGRNGGTGGNGGNGGTPGGGRSSGPGHGGRNH